MQKLLCGLPWNSFMSSEQAIYTNGTFGVFFFFHKRKQYMFTIKRQTNKNNFPMLSSYCQKHYSLELSFLWKQSKCKCIIFSVYVTKIPSGDHQCNLLGFLERTDTIPNLSSFNVKYDVRIFNICQVSLPTPQTWSVNGFNSDLGRTLESFQVTGLPDRSRKIQFQWSSCNILEEFKWILCPSKWL